MRATSLLALSVSALLFLSSALSAQNPLTPEGKYFSDPAARVWDGSMWLYCSSDESTSHYCSKNYEVLSSKDLSQWTIHPGAFSSAGPDDRVPYNDEYLYAPDCIRKDGLYHLFYCQSGGRGVEGVAVSTSPEGPFSEGKVLEGVDQIDPSVFIDEDGTPYLFWGQYSAKAAQLTPSLDAIIPSTYKDGIITEGRHHFHEGIQVLKRNGIYYLVFADISRRGRPTSLGYATSSSPMGPYTYRGVIIDNYGSDPSVWNNHGSIVEFGGQWYVLYHRSTHNGEYMRVPCIERLRFTRDGAIQEAEMTSSGALPALDPLVTTPAYRACMLSGTTFLKEARNDERTVLRLVNIHRKDTAIYRYYAFTGGEKSVVVDCVPGAGGRIVFHRTHMNGPVVASVEVPAAREGGEGEVIQVEASLRESLRGRESLFVRFEGRSTEPLYEVEAFTFK